MSKIATKRKFKIGDKFRLAHKVADLLPVVYQFELLSFRGSKLYFFNENRGIDKVISRVEFERLKAIADTHTEKEPKK